MKALEIIEYFGAEEMVNNNTPFEEQDYAEAIKELEELENRSCDNCNFSNIDTYFTDYGKCEKGYGFLFNGRVEVIKDFCCNKWGAKNENL